MNKKILIKIKYFLGELVDEIHQKMNDWVSQVIRIYKDSEYIEFDWLVGPIPTEYGFYNKMFDTIVNTIIFFF